MTQRTIAQDDLAHYGVKGMHWGVHKTELDTPNSSYSKGQRNYDKQNYGAGSVKRINRRLNKGARLKEARNSEVAFRNRRALAVAGAAFVGTLAYERLKLSAGDIAKRAETNRGRASAAATMGLPRHASSGPTYAKPNRSGSYNITSF